MSNGESPELRAQLVQALHNIVADYEYPGEEGELLEIVELVAADKAAGLDVTAPLDELLAKVQAGRLSRHARPADDEEDPPGGKNSA
jgi:hypothetical protein